MENNLKDLSSKEIIEMYSKNRNFINFLDKEIKDMEKKRDEK